MGSSRKPHRAGALAVVVVALVAAALAPTAEASITSNEPAPLKRRSIGDIPRSGLATRGDLTQPYLLALAPNGDVVVPDQTNHRVVRFAADGSFVWRIGGDRRGSGPGEFDQPTAVAVAPGGDVYVADSNNDRVQRFAADGSFVSSWGTEGPAPGQFQGPEAIAVAPDGDVWVLEQSRVQRFSASGTFEAAWGDCCTGPAILVGSRGIALGPDGTVYVTSYLRHKVQRFSPTGDLLASWGSLGTGGGQFNRPHGIAVDASGDVIVADTSNQRIQRFDPDGVFESSFTPQNQPRGVAVSAAGDLFVSSGFRVEHFTGAGSLVAAWGQSGDGWARFDGPSDVAVAPDGGLVVADRRNHRITRSGPDLFFGTAWGSQGSGPGQFSYPEGVAVAPNGSIYVADTGNDRVQRLHDDGTFDRQWGTHGSGPGRFEQPAGIAVGPGGDVWVTDRFTAPMIQRFAADGTYEASFGSYGTGPGQFDQPSGIAVGDEGVFVADTRNRRIQRFDLDGTFVDAWPTTDGAEPVGIDVDRRGGVWVSTLRTHPATGSDMRVARYSADGVRLSTVDLADEAGGITTHPNGRIYVAARSAGNLIEVEIGAGPLVAVTLEAMAPAAEVGRRVDFRLTVRNTGDVAQTGLQAAYSGTPECDGPLPSLAVGEAVERTCSHLVTPADVGTFVAQASVTSSQVGAPVQSVPGPATMTVTYAAPVALGVIGGPGSGPGQFVQASDLDVGPGGELVVANRRSLNGAPEVDVFDAAGRHVRSFDTVDGSGAVAVAPDGQVYVDGRVPNTYAGVSFVARFSPTGVGGGTFGSMAGRINDLDVRPDGHTVVLHNRVASCVWDTDLQDYVCTYRGSSGWSAFDAAGMAGPSAATDSGRSLAASATRVHVGRGSLGNSPDTGIRTFDASTGGLLATTLTDGDRPAGLDLDPMGNLYASFQDSQEVRVYSPSGGLLARWSTPAGEVAVGPDGLVYVLDAAASVVRVFGFGISGTVADEVTDLPLSGVVALAVDAVGHVAGAAVTGSRGAYRLAVGPGQYRVVFVDPSGTHLGEWAWGHALSDPTAAAAVSVGVTGATVNIGLLPGRGSVAGTVTADGSGGVVAGAWVAAIDQATGVLRGTAAAPDGTFSSGGLPPGNQTVVFVDPSGQRRFEFFDDAPFASSANPVAVTAGSTTTANASLAAQGPFSSGSSITGTVTDDGTGDPVAGAWVVAVRTDGVMRAGATTNGAGQYSLGVGPGSYRVQVLDPAGTHLGQWVPDRGLDDYDGAQVVTVGAAGTATVDAGLGPNRGSIAGVVTNPTGPAAGTVVLAVSTSTGQVAGAATVAGGGEYRVAGLVPGGYLVAFVDPWGEHGFEYHDGVTNPFAATPVTVAAGATRTVDADVG